MLWFQQFQCWKSLSSLQSLLFALWMCTLIARWLSCSVSILSVTLPPSLSHSSLSSVIPPTFHQPSSAFDSASLSQTSASPFISGRRVIIVFFCHQTFLLPFVCRAALMFVPVQLFWMNWGILIVFGGIKCVGVCSMASAEMCVFDQRCVCFYFVLFLCLVVCCTGTPVVRCTRSQSVWMWSIPAFTTACLNVSTPAAASDTPAGIYRKIYSCAVSTNRCIPTTNTHTHLDLHALRYGLYYVTEFYWETLAAQCHPVVIDGKCSLGWWKVFRCPSLFCSESDITSNLKTFYDLWCVQNHKYSVSMCVVWGNSLIFVCSVPFQWLFRGVGLWVVHGGQRW